MRNQTCTFVFINASMCLFLPPLGSQNMNISLHNVNVASMLQHEHFLTEVEEGFCKSAATSGSGPSKGSPEKPEGSSDAVVGYN